MSLLCEFFFKHPYATIPGCEMEVELGVCASVRQRQKDAEKLENKHFPALQILRDSPPPTTCLSCLFPSFSIPCTNVGAISHITICSTVHTDSTPCAKLRGQVSASREKKQRQWQVGKTGVQAVGDNGMSQQRREADHNAETNAVWKAESITIIIFFLSTWNLPQNQ